MDLDSKYSVDPFHIGLCIGYENFEGTEWKRTGLHSMIELDTYLALRVETECKSEILETLVELDQLIEELSGE